MNEQILKVTELKTDLRKMKDPGRVISAVAELSASPMPADSYLACTDGRVLSIVPVATNTDSPQIVMMPVGMAYAKDGKSPLITLSGEWRRVQPTRYNTFPPDAKVEVSPAIEPDSVRFPQFQSPLPSVSTKTHVSLTIDVDLIKKLALAIAEDGKTVTLLLPPTSRTKSAAQPEGIDTRCILEVIPVVADRGIGCVSPIGIEGNLSGAAARCRIFGTMAENYAIARLAGLANKPPTAK